MFEIEKIDKSEPTTKARSVRFPIYQLKQLDKLSKETGVNVSQIVIQMITYCLNNMK